MSVINALMLIGVAAIAAVAFTLGRWVERHKRP